MKKFLMLALLLFMTSCDFGTESKKEDPQIPQKDTTKVLIRKSVVISDTNISTTHTMNIFGKISEKNSSGKDIGGFPSIVCLESSKKCVKTNSKGQYSFTTPRINFSARSLGKDTTLTPENILPDTTSDTVKHIDSVIVLDTVTTNDTVYVIDTIKVLHNLYVDNDSTHVDSVLVYSDSRVLYEIPVTSWKSILPEKYVVQRDISGHILKNSYSNETKNAEAIYWSVDSIALRIPLELSDDKLAYSGFVYQPYDDSSFTFGIKNKNLFVRILDGNDSVFGISNVVNFSERSGDLSVFLKDIVPGAIQRYPKPNKFTVIKDGENVSTVLSSEIIPAKYMFDLDSLFLRSMFTKTVDTVPALKSIDIGYVVNGPIVSTFDTNYVDSIGISFYSNISDTIELYTNVTSPDSKKSIIKFDLIVDSGYNIFSLKWYNKTRQQDFPLSKDIVFSIAQFQENSITDIRVKLWMKK